MMPNADSIMGKDNHYVLPIEIRLKTAEKRLEVDFDNGVTFLLPAEYLRVKSPSAEVQEHSQKSRELVLGKCNVNITNIEPVGNYAIRILFDDGHETGLYTWKYLYKLGEQQGE
jgi:DUF971 family protein